jgi:MFS family permease|tara:strand:- start:3496 stop:4788 length:1293 start_codon:yes stop_codon:yes gene_type:complete
MSTASDQPNLPDEEAPQDKSTFASLKNRDYLYLWTGMLASAFAMNMQLVAQGWLIYEMSSSALNLTWVTLSFMLPQVIFSLPGGVLADRLPKKPVIMWAPAGNALITVIMAVIIITDRVTFWDFIWVGFLNGTVMALSIPARTAFIPEIVGERLIFNAMAFNTAAWNLARILGPALAGFMIAMFAGGDTTSVFGVGLVYFVLSALYLVSAVTVLFIGHSGEPSGERKNKPLNDVLEGLTYVINSPVVGGLILLSIVPFLFGLSINTLLPAFNTDVLDGGADDLGLLMTAMGVGAIAGSLTLANLGELRNKGYWLLATGSLWGVAVTLFALSSSYPFAIICIGLVGFISAVNMSMNRSIVQLQVTQEMRGRIMSIDMMSHGLMPLGIVPIGWIAEEISVQAGLATSGVMLAGLTILLGVYLAKVRSIDTGY